MAIDLLNRFTSGQVNKVSTTQNASVPVSDSAEAARIVRSVYAMKAGDTLQGELVSAKGTDISLLLGDVVTLQAKLDKELALTPGQMMSFTVNSNKHGKLSLSPLFANTGMEQNAIKALDAASIPVTDKTMAMAEELMKQGMPINKQTLSTVYRQMGMYPEAEVADLVMLNKMNIPVSDENISNMYLYRTNQQYLFSDLQGLGSQMADMLMDMNASGQTDAVTTFIKGFVQIFANTAENVAVSNESMAGMQNPQGVLPDVGNVNHTPVTVLSSDGEGVMLSELAGEETGTQIENKVIISENSADSNMSAQSSAAREAELLKLVHEDGAKTPEGKTQLTQSLFSLLKEQMLMNPDEFRSSEYVKEFYEKLNDSMEKLQELLKSVGKEASPLAKETGTVKSNIQFMNQINELYHYVQLPIKMNHAQAKGDLYVYKRKQAKTGDDGKLTALLHLSMPTLGNMDVFLTLQEGKLSTRFCMEKEELIDFMEAHMDQLNERLMKKGYQVQTSVTAGSKEEKTVIENIMDNELPIPIMTSRSFDARC